jgi:hypothetical protein
MNQFRSILTKLVFPFGVIFGILCYMILDLFNSLSTSDVINLAGIVVNIIIGAAIVFIIQKRLSDDRGVKDYFIKEVCDIKDEYSKFINKLFNSGVTTKHTLEWFKSISTRISQLEHFMEYELQIDSPSILILNRELHQIVTSSTEFNNSFKKTSYSPSNASKNKISDAYKNLKFSFVRAIVIINKA